MQNFQKDSRKQFKRPSFELFPWILFENFNKYEGLGSLFKDDTAFLQLVA